MAATCEQCGYDLRGLPGDRGLVVCPECSCSNSAREPRPLSSADVGRIVASLLAPALAVCVLELAVGILTGNEYGGWTPLGFGVTGVGATAAVAELLRRKEHSRPRLRLIEWLMAPSMLVAAISPIFGLIVQAMLGR